MFVLHFASRNVICYVTGRMGADRESVGVFQAPGLLIPNLTVNNELLENWNIQKIANARLNLHKKNSYIPRSSLDKRLRSEKDTETLKNFVHISVLYFKIRKSVFVCHFLYLLTHNFVLRIKNFAQILKGTLRTNYDFFS